MSRQPHVGLSLVKKAPLGLLVTLLVAVVANLLLPLNIVTLAYAMTGGIVCAALLLMYWLGRGGVFFIAGVSMPLLLVLWAPLASVAALLNLVSGFFLGFCLALVIYNLARPQQP
jgi:hypothetical protein